MINLTDPMVEDDMEIMLPPVGSIVQDYHDPKPISYSLTGLVCCVVCGLETIIWNSLWIQAVETCDRPSHYMARCVKQNCGMIAHSHVSSEKSR